MPDQQEEMDAAARVSEGFCPVPKCEVGRLQPGLGPLEGVAIPEGVRVVGWHPPKTAGFDPVAYGIAPDGRVVEL